MLLFELTAQILHFRTCLLVPPFIYYMLHFINREFLVIVTVNKFPCFPHRLLLREHLQAFCFKIL